MVNGFKTILPPGAATAVPAVALFLTTLTVESARAQQENTPLVGSLPLDSLAALISTAEQGDAAAQVSLGDMYLSGDGVPEDDSEAVRWYRAAAGQGYARAQFNLGLMYANGQGVSENDAEAVRWYRVAAEQGLDRAQFSLGEVYANGEGVLENDVLAYGWFNLAGAQGHERAREAKDQLSRQMTCEQVARAQELSVELLRTIDQRQSLPESLRFGVIRNT
ncbi:MAG: sel1 repeat family protein [Gemmatimonadetes bacterium]|nr:sel1 repeat family protein [Gemmatimonadota bacterium]MYD14313.1 sel1 repeat family protein [Gemmatimonadota bacterium]MYI67068.1 sel1 repeat family protein [Gemmatimonadota bacterium]